MSEVYEQWERLSLPVLTAFISRVQRRVRDARAGYVQSLEVLRAAKAAGVYTKSSLMLGLGEADDEVIDAMLDLRAAGAPRCKAFATLQCWAADARQRQDICHLEPAAPKHGASLVTHERKGVLALGLSREGNRPHDLCCWSEFACN